MEMESLPSQPSGRHVASGGDVATTMPQVPPKSAVGEASHLVGEKDKKKKTKKKKGPGE